MTVVYTRNRCIAGSGNYFIGKAFGTVTMILGYVIQGSLTGTCGDSAYAKCFVDCPLSNPMIFNHNALFHVVYLAGMCLLGVFEDLSPSVASKNFYSTIDDTDKNVHEIVV